MAGIDLVFESGCAPTPDDVRNAVERIAELSVSHDPNPGDRVVPITASQVKGEGRLILELVRHGLTFDLLEHAEGGAGQADQIVHRLDLPADFALVGRHMLRLIPGPHLSGAKRSLPVVRAKAGIAADLVRELAGVQAVSWAPSAVVASSHYFQQAIAAWAAGGPFPAPGLVTFRKAMGGAMQSSGMAYFTGQELRLEGDLAADEDQATRLAARLVDQLIHRGAITEAEQAIGPSGNALRIEPSTNGRYVRVWPG